MLEYYAHIVQEDLLVLNHQKTILKVSIKWLKEMVCHRAMNKLPRYVKRTFYCEECDRSYSTRYMDKHYRTYKHQCNLLMQENVPGIHPSEVKDILKE